MNNQTGRSFNHKVKGHLRSIKRYNVHKFDEQRHFCMQQAQISQCSERLYMYQIIWGQLLRKLKNQVPQTLHLTFVGITSDIL